MTKLNEKSLQALENFSVEYPKHQPINSGLIKEPDEEDFNFWNTLGDMALSAPQGVVNAVEEAGDFIDDNIISLGGLEFGDGDGRTSFRDFIPRFVPPSKWKAENYSD